MKANPGGLIAPEDVVGRDEFIEQLWHVLAQQSVILLAERRIGKSTILRKIDKEHSKNWLPLLWDVESINSLSRFVQGLGRQLEPFLSKTEQGKQWLGKLHQFFAGSKITGVEVPQVKQADWHDVLAQLLKNLGDHQLDHKQQVLLIWDEFPWMLQKIIKTEGHQAAGDLLDTLRHCRQSNDNLRMLFTGSIGLHQVINSLRAKGYSNEPVNDMEVISLGSLEKDQAIKLANALVAGEKLSDKTSDEDILSLCELVDNVPYYIHHLVRTMHNTGQSPSQIVKAAIAGEHNNWQLEHYYTRLEDYYPQHWQQYALVLDAIAYSDKPIRRKDIQRELTTGAGNYPQLQDKDQLSKMLRYLVSDNYLTQDIETAAYQFRYPLIKKWWRFYRD